MMPTSPMPIGIIARQQNLCAASALFARIDLPCGGNRSTPLTRSASRRGDLRIEMRPRKPSALKRGVGARIKMAGAASRLSASIMARGIHSSHIKVTYSRRFCGMSHSSRARGGHVARRNARPETRRGARNHHALAAEKLALLRLAAAARWRSGLLLCLVMASSPRHRLSAGIGDI